MTSLAIYLRAIHGLDSPARLSQTIVNHDCYVDQGYEVRCEDAHFEFEDGTCIHLTREEDDADRDAAACLPCRYRYEVTRNGPAARITPQRKHFDNHCQLDFWLAWHTTP